MRIALSLYSLLLASLLYAESVDEALEGFDDAPVAETSIPKTVASVDDEIAGFDNGFSVPNTTEETNKDPEMAGFDDTVKSDNNESTDFSKSSEDEEGIFSNFSGKIIQQLAVGYNNEYPQNVFASLRQTLFVDYERKFENGLKVKVNARAFYDPIYDVGNADYYPAEVDELRTELWLFEAYLEWSILENLDAKLGRQVVVWGRSDSIRITDILNPLDYRRPGMLDIEDLRLPTTMLKLDYEIDNWRISPIAIVEQRFSKYPPFGSIYYPELNINGLPTSLPVLYSDYEALGYPLFHIDDESYTDVTFALSANADFEGWDISLYASRLYQDQGYMDEVQQNDAKNKMEAGAKDVYIAIQHNKTNMFGGAVNYLNGSWLLKSEIAYFSDLVYSSTSDKSLSRTDILVGLEYSGLSSTTISYDFSLRHFNQYDDRLYVPFENFLERDTYQQAFRISSDFMNDTLHLNYLVSIFGKQADDGGFQRAWVDYEVADAINTKFGIVDYIDGSPLFERVSTQNIVFMDMSYNF